MNQHEKNIIVYVISIIWSCSSLQFPFLNPLDFLFPNNVRFNWIIPLNAMVVCKCRKVPFVFSFFAYSSAPFSFSFQNPDLCFPNHDSFVCWVCKSDWYCLFRSIAGDLRAFIFAWFDFYFHLNMHLGDGKRCLHLSIKLIQVIWLGLLLLHVILVSWLSWGAMLVVSHFLSLN